MIEWCKCELYIFKCYTLNYKVKDCYWLLANGRSAVSTHTGVHTHTGCCEAASRRHSAAARGLPWSCDQHSISQTRTALRPPRKWGSYLFLNSIPYLTPSPKLKQHTFRSNYNTMIPFCKVCKRSKDEFQSKMHSACRRHLLLADRLLQNAIKHSFL